MPFTRVPELLEVARRVRGGSYPQVEPRARDLMTRQIVTAPAAITVAEARRVVRRRRARLLVCPIGRTRPRWGGCTPAVLARACALGLGSRPVQAILWVAPEVTPDTPEVATRRKGGTGDRFVLVTEGSRVLGAVVRSRDPRQLPASATHRMDGLPAPVREVLAAARGAGRAGGWTVAAVGGLVRDLLGDAPTGRADIDLVVVGDAARLTRDLAARLGGTVHTHPSFGTATLTLRDGRRVDVARTRRERYARPGALPEVATADLAADLARRDFSVNALAIRLDGHAWGTVVDPEGGLADLRARRLRVLHPLSFVDDPTRAFRAVRLTCRLGFRMDAATRHLLAAATRLDSFAALSGDRLRHEIRRSLAEPQAGRVLEALGRVGVLRLVVPAWRASQTARARLRLLPGRLARLPLTEATVEALVILAAAADRGASAVSEGLARLSLPPAVRAAALGALSEAPPLVAAVDRATDPGQAYRLLRSASEMTLAWALLVTRRRRTRQWIVDHLVSWRSLRPLLTGDDALALGVPRGPAVGAWLEALRVAQVTGAVRSRDDAWRWATAQDPRSAPSAVPPSPPSPRRPR